MKGKTVGAGLVPAHMLKGKGFRCQISGCRFQGAGCRVQNKKKIRCFDCGREIKGHEVCISIDDFKMRCPRCADMFSGKERQKK